MQVGHLLEALGVQKYAPAEPLWRTYIKKDLAMGVYSRGAAIWALGRYHEGNLDGPLSRLLVERLTDEVRPPEPPEIMRVRVMSGVALGRMGAVAQVARMRKYREGKAKVLPSSLAIRWAIQELTGEDLPEPENIVQSIWFLEPLEEPEPEAP